MFSSYGNNQKQRLSLVLALVLGIMLLSASFVLAEQRVSKSENASANGTVIIENIAGSIKVIGWGKEKISVEGVLGDDVEELEFTTGKKKCRIKVVYPRKIRRINEGADLTIMVPRGSLIEVDCVSADIDVTKVDGQVLVESISGEVTVSGQCEKIEAESISGSVFVEGSTPDVVVKSISGRVEVEGTSGVLEAETVSGSIRVDYSNFMELSVESVSGDVDVAGALDIDGRFSFEVHSGDLTLTVPADTSAEFEITTFSGDIYTDYGYKARRTSRHAPGKELEFRVGDGDARVDINTFSGEVQILKR